MGKKSTPTAPAAPDPVATSKAQIDQNIAAATAQANLNRIDQYTPQGNLTYSQIGTNADGTPRYAQTQTYSASEQQKYDQGNKVAFGLNDLAISNMGRVADTQGKDFNFDKMTPQVLGVGGGLPGMNYGQGGANPVQSSIADQGKAGAIGVGQEGRASAIGLGEYGQAGAVGDQGRANAMALGENGKASAMPFGIGGKVQGGLDYSGLTQLPGANDFGAEGQKMADSVYNQYKSRLDPQFQQSQSDMEAKLAAQGISNNSDAYRREIDNAGRTRNDAYGQAAYQAQQAGAGEQSRLFGLNLSARQQGQNEVNTQGAFANTAQNQNFGQAAQTFDQQNQAQQQNFGQAQQTYEQQNAAQNQNFGQAYQTQEQRNAAQGQNFGQAYQTYDQRNAAQNQNFGQTYQAYGQQNQAQGQNYDQALGIADLFNNAQNQQFSQGQSAAGFSNAAQNQAFNQQGSNAALNNAGRQQQISEASYLRNLPLNEIAALMGTAGGVSDPNFQPVSQVGVAAPDYQGMVQNNYNSAQQQYQQQQAARSQMIGSLANTAGSAATMFMMSDRRLKYDIRRVGTLANGLKTYAFKYLGSKAQQFGVMAQDVLKVRPDAVGVAPNGYLFIDYARVL